MSRLACFLAVCALLLGGLRPAAAQPAVGAPGAAVAQAALLAVIDRTTLPLPGLKADEHRYLVSRIYNWAEQRLGGRVRVMTEQNTYTLLQDMGINPADCVQQDCEVAIGRKIGADWLIVSKIYRFDERSPFIFELGLYQTGTSAFHGAQEARAVTVIELSDRAREAADKVFDRLLEKLGGVERAATAQVVFLMEPGPVFVLRDGQAIGTLAVPASGRLRLDTAPGSHEFVFSREGRQDWRQVVEADPDAPREIPVQFQAGQALAQARGSGMGLLRVASEPGGATIHLDDVEVGTTTRQLVDIAAGTHRVRLSKPLYKTREVDVTVVEDAVAEVSETLAPDFAAVEVLSRPPGAAVLVDGQEKGRTPWRVERFPAGRYALRLRKDLYHDHEQALLVEAGVPARLDLPLQAAFGSLRVEAHPEGARVFVDESDWGRAPVQRDTVLSGRHAVRVHQELFNDYESWVEVTDGGRHTVTADLSADYGTLVLGGTPAGARVLVDGRDSGALPLELRLRPGSHQLRVAAPDHDPLEEAVSVAVGDRRERNVALRRQVGGLRILVEPPDAVIYLDDRRLGSSPQILKDLPTGRHEIRASLAEHADHSQVVEILDGRQEHVEIALSKTAWLEYARRRTRTVAASCLVPGGGQLLSGRPRGLLYTLGAAGGIWLAVEAARRYDTLEQDYDEAGDRYHESIEPTTMAGHFADMEDAWRDMRTQRNQHLAGIGLASVAWLGGVVDGWFWGGGSRDTGMEQALHGKDGSAVVLELRPTWSRPGVAVALSW